MAPKPTAATSTTTATPKWIQRFRCVRTAWITPSTAKLKLWKSDWLRCAVITGPSSRRVGALARLHVVPVLVPEEMQ